MKQMTYEEDLRITFEREDLDELRNRIGSGALTDEATTIAKKVLAEREGRGEAPATAPPSVGFSGRRGAVTLFVFIALCGLAFRLLRPLIDRLGH